MITKLDCINYVDNYLIYSNQDPEEWCVEGAASELLDWCRDNDARPDDMDVDDFNDMLESYYID